MSTDEYEDKYNYDMYAGYQIQHLNEDFERLRPSQFETEDAYRAALIEQYRGIREAEYRAVCYNKGLEMYKDSMAAIVATGNKREMNRSIWNGLQDIPTNIVPADSIARRTPMYVMDRYEKAGSDQTHCCAVTGSTVVQAICDEMNCCDEANIVTFDDKSNFKYYHTGAGHFMFDPNTKGYNGSGTLSDLIREGKIDAGDRIASSNGAGASNSTSGKHERVVVSVERNGQGEVLGYTLQANNPAELSFHRIGDPTDKMNKTHVEYASTKAWMDHQIAEECLALESLTSEEIQQQISEKKEHTAEVIRNTATDKEKSLIEGNVNTRFSDKYDRDYVQYHQKMREEQAKMFEDIQLQVAELQLAKGIVVDPNAGRATIKDPIVESRVIHKDVEGLIQKAEALTPKADEVKTSEEGITSPEKTDAEKLLALRGLAPEKETGVKDKSPNTPVKTHVIASVIEEKRSYN